jgi:hypothetical protein
MITGARKISGRGKGVLGHRGASALGCLFSLLVLGAAAYVGLKVGGAYYDYFEARHKIREALNWAVAGQPKTEAEMIQKVTSLVRQTGLELKPREVKITHSGENLTVSVSWKREVEFPGYILPLNFSVNLTEIKRWTRGGLIIK